MRAKRTDCNQREIVADLRKRGYAVDVRSDVGKGLPDLIVYDGSILRLVEVKMPGEDLNEREFKWWTEFGCANTHVVHSVEEARLLFP